MRINNRTNTVIASASALQHSRNTCVGSPSGPEAIFNFKDLMIGRNIRDRIKMNYGIRVATRSTFGLRLKTGGGSDYLA